MKLTEEELVPTLYKVEVARGDYMYYYVVAPNPQDAIIKVVHRWNRDIDTSKRKNKHLPISLSDISGCDRIANIVLV